MRDGAGNPDLYQSILEGNVCTSVCERNQSRKWVMQGDNLCGSTKDLLKKNTVNVVEQPSQTPDLNPIEMLLKFLKRAVHIRKPTNIADLTLFCPEEWANIPPD